MCVCGVCRDSTIRLDAKDGRLACVPVNSSFLDSGDAHEAKHPSPSFQAAASMVGGTGHGVEHAAVLHEAAVPWLCMHTEHIAGARYYIGSGDNWKSKG